jgi:hypothetical protein
MRPTKKCHIGMAAFAVFFMQSIVPGPSAAAGASAVIVASYVSKVAPTVKYLAPFSKTPAGSRRSQGTHSDCVVCETGDQDGSQQSELNAHMGRSIKRPLRYSCVSNI